MAQSITIHGAAGTFTHYTILRVVDTETGYECSKRGFGSKINYRDLYKRASAAIRLINKGVEPFEAEIIADVSKTWKGLTPDNVNRQIIENHYNLKPCNPY